MIYELRTYEVVPGKMPALLERFRHTTVSLFERHGIRLVGFWTVEIGTSNQLIYLLAYPDWASREQAWATFRADAEWQAAVRDTEQAGPLIERIHNALLRPTDFSPLQ